MSAAFASAPARLRHASAAWRRCARRVDFVATGEKTTTMRYGYKASAEQFAPRQLMDCGVLAESLGLTTIAISDQIQPWRHAGGHTPAVCPWLGAIGERTTSALLGTSVLTPTMRYHPSIVAQSFATLASLCAERVFMGVGTGEALNETPATSGRWPGAKERRMMLRESLELIRSFGPRTA
jgi:coenzyme F420-dependent glucose-6-phosphate dehydrogenase